MLFFLFEASDWEMVEFQTPILSGRWGGRKQGVLGPLEEESTKSEPIPF